MELLIVGFGFIGQTLARTIYQKIELIKRADRDLKIIGVSDSEGYLLDEKGLDLERLSKISGTSDYSERFLEGGSSLEMIEVSGADIMVEATPTNIKDGEPGLTHMKTALTLGIDVVTANKGPLVVAFRDLQKLAESMGCEFRYEGTVAGAMPVFSLVDECLQGDRIIKVSGILNGTTNFILSKMYFEETSFEIALKEAQERGITEKDPTYDVDGIDAACKVVILANAIMDRDAKLKDVERVGIRGITTEAVSLAKRSNFAIKLIGTIDKNLEVAPKLVPINHPLCVHGTLNALHFETDLAKELTVVGYGAGKETVSAVLNDIISILKRKAGST